MEVTHNMDTIEIYGKKYKVYDFDELKGKHYGFIYVTINNLTGKKYLGLHTKWNKNYLGSGNYLLTAIKKYGKENFTRYIIDVADSYEELIHLEAEYITKKFQVNLAKSDDWYNITSGLQRGGNTWEGMSEEDRIARAKKVSKANKGKRRTEEQKEYNRAKAIEWYSKPGSREKISLATKEAMTKEVRERMSKGRSGITPTLSPEQKEAQRQRMRLVGQIGRPAWNKGKPMQEDSKLKLRESMAPEVTVLLDGEVLLEKERILGGVQAIADRLYTLTGIKLGKNHISALAKSGEGFIPKIPRHEPLRGMKIEIISYLDRSKKGDG